MVLFLCKEHVIKHRINFWPSQVYLSLGIIKKFSKKKVKNLIFKINFQCQRIILFSIKSNSFKAHFLVKTFLEIPIFETLFIKSGTIFVSIYFIHKIQWFPLSLLDFDPKILLILTHHWRNFISELIYIYVPFLTENRSVNLKSIL